jgi:hypothetical protein
VAKLRLNFESLRDCDATPPRLDALPSERDCLVRTQPITAENPSEGVMKNATKKPTKKPTKLNLKREALRKLSGDVLENANGANTCYCTASACWSCGINICNKCGY